MIQTRHTPRAGVLSLAPDVDLVRARAHEASGPSRHLFALLVGGVTEGPVLWLRPTWSRDVIFGDGARAFLDPGRIVFGAARTANEILWAAEEALRTGLMPRVVIEEVTICAGSVGPIRIGPMETGSVAWGRTFRPPLTDMETRYPKVHGDDRSC